MHALTIDHLSNGRLILGLGASGPQVVEGWYGQPYRKPLARTREYVEIIRRVIAREEPLEFDGEFYQHPYHGEGSTGLGKPLKSITHPLRREIPIYLGAEGPKNVTMTAEIADGWIPLYYSPFRQEVYADQLAGAKEDFEVVALANITVTDDIEAGLAPVKAMLAFYIGGMGAKGQNFHTELLGRMGFEEEALRIQELFFEGRRDEAIEVVPTEFADEISLVGPPGRIKERLAVWEDSPVTTVTCYPGNPQDLRRDRRHRPRLSNPSHSLPALFPLTSHSVPTQFPLTSRTLPATLPTPPPRQQNARNRRPTSRFWRRQAVNSQSEVNGSSGEHRAVDRWTASRRRLGPAPCGRGREAEAEQQAHEHEAGGHQRRVSCGGRVGVTCVLRLGIQSREPHPAARSPARRWNGPSG